MNVPLLVLLPLCFVATAVQVTEQEARSCLVRAVRFFRGQVAAHGGYLWRYSHDLKYREGEGIADAETVWVQPPGTPTVGMAYLLAYERTREPTLLEAAKAAGTCLISGQLRSGGWTYSIRFADEARRRFAYRSDPERPDAFNVSTLDDDTTQSAIRFLLHLDRVLKGRDQDVHSALLTALDALVKAQYPNGAFPQGFDGPSPTDCPILAATLPPSWPRTWPNKPYWRLYTLNDNVMGDTIATLLEAARFRRSRRLRDAAVRGSEFLLRAQLPDPQPAWAQQYDENMHPAWARRFEPPAVSGGESQQVIETLLDLAEETRDRRFLQPIPRAIAYLRRSLLPDGRLARFYELGTNRPLYCNRVYELTYDDTDTPTHYSFKVPSRLDALERHYRRLLVVLHQRKPTNTRKQPPAVPSASEVRDILASQDARGAWVEPGTLRYHPPSIGVSQIVTTETFARNLDLLSRYIEHSLRSKRR